MKISFNPKYDIEIENCNIDTIVGLFKKHLSLFLGDLIVTILQAFAESYMKNNSLPFCCDKCGSNDYHWKTRNAKPTKLTTVFCDVTLPQFQIQCNNCGKKTFITRKLLSISPYKKMSKVTSRIFALLGSFTTFRVSEKILGMFGVPLNRMTIWRCVQEEGGKIEFGLDPNESAIGQADGTGIPIQGIMKRGKELKVFVQEKIGGGVRIAGLAIGNYDSGWDKLFEPLKEQIKRFKIFELVTDGDTSILKGLGNLKVVFQRCLWHIPHQMKYYLWKDGVKRKSKEWYHVIGKLLDITAIRPMIYDDKEIDSVIKIKNKHLEELISHCRKNGWKSSTSYLTNAQPDMFSAFKNRLSGKTTSKAERVMRTVNLRINVGKWSMKGALNAMKIRLAHYYNGYDVGDKDVIDNEQNSIQVTAC